MLGDVVTEVTVGCGPAGELRYPAYPERDRRWRFPGVGEFQCYDAYMRRSLRKAAEAANKPDWYAPARALNVHSTQRPIALRFSAFTVGQRFRPLASFTSCCRACRYLAQHCLSRPCACALLSSFLARLSCSCHFLRASQLVKRH